MVRFLTDRLAVTLLGLALTAPASGADGSSSSMTCMPEEDKVHGIPGWDQPLPSAWYSGYLDYEFQGQQLHTHYLLVEAEGDDKAGKPLIYWTNGGPGASSFYGFLTELGPLQLSDDSLLTEEARATGIPTPIYTKTNWARFGHLLIIDQPAPIGFSYCNNDGEDNPDAHNCGDISWTDELTSLNTYTALQKFYEKFPCLSKGHDLYITGESYGGIYVPTLVRRIYEGSDGADDDDSPKALLKENLKGFAVGDGCLGTETGICSNIADAPPIDFWRMLFLAGHNQIPFKSFKELMQACKQRFDDIENRLDENGNVIFDKLSAEDDECEKVAEKIYKEMGGVFDYSLYDECTYRNGLSARNPISGALNDYACGGGVVMENYLHRDDVKKALNVRSTFFAVDNAEGDFDYTPTEPNISGFYKEINGKLRVLVYNGDVDPAITSFATEFWTSKLGIETTEEWRPWSVDGCRRMGGYVTRYEGGLDVLTIRGAGHMVPTYKPDASFTYMKAWFENTSYPEFDPDCTDPGNKLQELDVSKESSTSSMLRSSK